MKYLLIFLLLMACSKNEECKVNITSSSCAELALMLDGSFAYKGDSQVPCIVFVEGNSYYFYSDYSASGVKLGLAMAVNRNKLKMFNKCVKTNKELTSEEALLLDRRCRKKLGMKDEY